MSIRIWQRKHRFIEQFNLFKLLFAYQKLLRSFVPVHLRTFLETAVIASKSALLRTILVITSVITPEIPLLRSILVIISVITAALIIAVSALLRTVLIVVSIVTTLITSVSILLRTAITLIIRTLWSLRTPFACTVTTIELRLGFCTISV